MAFENLRLLGAAMGLLIVIVAAPSARASESTEAPTAIAFEIEDGSIVVAPVLDRLPTGYLVRVDGESIVVPYEAVLSVGPGANEVRDLDERRGSRGVVADPRPRRSGLGGIIAGWIMFGSGALVTFYALAIPSEVDVDEVTTPIAIAGGVVATAGLVLAISGHRKFSASNRAIREWEARQRQGLMVVPFVAPDVAGLAVLTRF